MKYKLYDLEVATIGDPKTFNCSHKVGEGFYIKGENLIFNPSTKKFSHYALGSLMPYIAAKQRAVNEDDWMHFESTIACPDPACGAVFEIRRVKESVYEYGEGRVCEIQ